MRYTQRDRHQTKPTLRSVQKEQHAFEFNPESVKRIGGDCLGAGHHEVAAHAMHRFQAQELFA
jgi:hypothetical protein